MSSRLLLRLRYARRQAVYEARLQRFIAEACAAEASAATAKVSARFALGAALCFMLAAMLLSGLVVGFALGRGAFGPLAAWAGSVGEAFFAATLALLFAAVYFHHRVLRLQEALAFTEAKLQRTERKISRLALNPEVQP
jgi:hypothetical protein